MSFLDASDRVDRSMSRTFATILIEENGWHESRSPFMDLLTPREKDETFCLIGGLENLVGKGLCFPHPYCFDI